MNSTFYIELEPAAAAPAVDCAGAPDQEPEAASR